MLYIWKLSQQFKTALIDDENGISAVEYALLGAFIIAGLATTMPDVRDAIDGALSSMKDSLPTKAPAA